MKTKYIKNYIKKTFAKISKNFNVGIPRDNIKCLLLK